MNSFKDYVKKKYPSYYEQKNLLSVKQNLNDFDVENIEKSLNHRHNVKNKSAKLDKLKDEENLLKINKKHTQSRVKIFESSSFSMSKNANLKQDLVSTTLGSFNSKSKANNLSNELSGYDLDEFKTSPPVGWKRPPSRATLMAKAMLENKKSSNGKSTTKTRSNTDKEIYLEAIYREDFAGQIFMKFLTTKNKTVRNNS